MFDSSGPPSTKPLQLVPAPLNRSSPCNDPLVPTIFHSPWWLNVASEGRYEEVTVKRDGAIVARMPYVVTKRFGFYRVCVAPELTHFLGPAILSGSGSQANRSLKHHHLVREMLQQLQPYQGFHQQMHAEVSDTLAFEESGYSTMVKFTYEIAPQSIAAAWDAMRDKTRNVVRRASERYLVEEIRDGEQFAATYNENLRSRGLINRYSRIASLFEAANARNQGRVLGIQNKGQLLGAVFLVWDHRTVYYLLSTRVQSADNSVMSLLLWEAISLAMSAGLTFDFDGLGTSGSRVFYTGFGGQIKPRYVVYRNALSLRGMNELDRRLTRLLGRPTE